MGVFEEAFTSTANIMSTSSLSSFGYVVKAAKTEVLSITATNINASARYLRLYNTSSTVDPVTYTAVFKAAIPTASTFTWAPITPMTFSDGLVVIATSTGAEATGGSPTAGNVFCSIQYN